MRPAIEIRAGPPAFSQARLNAKLRELRRVEPGLRGAFAEFVHILFLAAALDARASAIVDALLAYGPRRGLPKQVGSPLLVMR